jgi:hypothetical protein
MSEVRSWGFLQSALGGMSSIIIDGIATPWRREKIVVLSELRVKAT